MRLSGSTLCVFVQHPVSGLKRLYQTQERFVQDQAMGSAFSADFFGQIGIIFWFLAVMNILLGQATALFQSSAIFVTILSPIILKEKVGIYRGSAVLIGLIGIIMTTNPFDGGVWALYMGFYLQLQARY